MIIENDVTRAIFERQSIREYTNERLSDSEIETLMKAAISAPSARNLQPCHVRIITNRDILDEMNRDFKDFVGYDTPAYSRYSTNPVYQNAPSMMMIFSENASKLDAGIMVENVAVCAKGIGLDSVIILSIRQLFDSPSGNKWKKFLSIPENYQFDIAISIGHGNEKPEKKPRNEEQFKIIK